MVYTLGTRGSVPKGTKEQLQALETENERLRQLVGEKAVIGAIKNGYVNKYRPYATSSLWAKTWEPRYVVVQENELLYYKSEKDMHYPPRGQIRLQGTYVDVEGLKRKRWWTFKIVDRLGVDLIRLSTESHSEMTSWIDALEMGGCVKRDEDRSGHSANEPGSPSNSGISGDGEALAGTGSLLQGRYGTVAEVDSVGDIARLRDSKQQQPQSGYTSDQSDVGARTIGSTRDRRNVKKKGLGTGFDGCVPVHTHPKFSLLSSERIRVSNQSGLLTLMFIILAATNFRLILENMIKYGFRFNPITFIRVAITPSGNIPLLLCWPGLLLFGVTALNIEKLSASMMRREISKRYEAQKKDVSPDRISKENGRWAFLSETLSFVLSFCNTNAALFVPFYVIHATEAEPLPAFALTMATIVLWLKLVSFAHVNWSLRQLKRIDPRRRWPGEALSGSEPLAVESEDMVYPQNLNLGNLLYFLVAPTLCYQLSYPRSPRFRIKWLLRRVFMLSTGLGMMLFIIEQYIEPTIDNSIKPLQDMDWLVMIERILKLSIPTLYFWLAMFYSLFELWLNILAEITRFGDREFYKEWWNATTLGEYWRLWNMPVHKWMLRHLYFPATNIGIPKFAAGVLVFFVSAVFHEVLVGVPLHMIRGWAFWGLMAQVPLMWVTEQLKRTLRSDRIGNVIFWVSFCFLGQPLAEILYFHDYRKSHQF